MISEVVLWFAETIWLFLPAYFANAAPVLLHGGGPIDGGRVWSDGRRLLGDHKTVYGTLSGVVVDSITGLYRLEAGDPARSFSENKELNHQLGVIREMALTTASAFLLTGQVRSVIGSPTPEVEPVAERLLRFWSDAVLRLDATPVPGVRHATLEKPETSSSSTR